MLKFEEETNQITTKGREREKKGMIMTLEPTIIRSASKNQPETMQLEQFKDIVTEIDY